MTQPNLSTLKGLAVLLADDEEINRILVQAILEQEGLEVTIVANGQEALTAARGEHFDIIILDIQMPVMDGFETCTLLRQTDNSTPVIAMTAHSADTYRQKCLEHGFNDYIIKPFKGAELLAMIASLATPGSGA